MDIERLKGAIQDGFPEIEIRAATPMLDGWDSVVLDINGEYIFRFPRRPDVEAQLEKEIALLPELAKTLPLAVPRFEFFGRGGPEGLRFVGYRKIKGVPLEAEVAQSHRRPQLVRQLARFLTAL
ncbi:MAG: phosphotransferase, partial [Chloroflexi bacterium]|nr:phosphotransferase [Chloroflexota bacterium]